MNNLPEINLPDDAPSGDIFKIVRENSTPLDLNIPMSQEEEEQEETVQNEEMDSEHEGELVIDIQDEDQDKEEQTARQAQAQTQSTQTQSTRPKERRADKQQEVRRTDTSTNLGLRFFASANDKIPHKPNLRALHRLIEDKKVKYIYQTDLLTEQDLIRYVKEGKITADKYPVETVDHSVFKKIRCGQNRRTSGDLEAKRRGKD